MARSSRSPSDGVATALGFHLCLYCVVAAGFGFGLYLLFQPTRFPNPGVAAYKPPPGTVVTYTPPLQRQNDRALVGSPEPTKPEPETTGLSIRGPVAELIVQPTSQPESETVTPPLKRPSKPASRRDVQPESATPQRSACIPSYDSSGAQTGAC
jgi:hypothetical protein